MKNPRKQSPKFIAVGLLSLLTGVPMYSADYYCDPAAGGMSNPGTSSSPWSTLEAVFSANKTFVAGDVIHLRNGHHGHPTIKGANSGTVTIKAQTGHSPSVKKITAQSPASRWLISGLRISTETSGSPETGVLVSIPAGCSYFTVQDCLLYGATGTAGWTASDWATKANSGFSTHAPHTVLLRNTLRNVGAGISVQPQAQYTQVTENLIENFCYDGIIGLANDSTYEYNVVRNSHNLVDPYHRDGFQSYSYSYYPGGSPGHGVVSNVTLRGNVFISQTDPNQPFSIEDGHNMHGIGCFDGMFDGWVVENNLIVNGSAPGIVFLGATNCRIVNNTVVRNPLKPSHEHPRIEVSAHKSDTGPYSNVYSNNNVVRNNVAGGSKFWHSSNLTNDHNLFGTGYATGYFANYAAFDFRPLPGGPLVDAGDGALAPAIDLDGDPRPQGADHDIGAYEYGTVFADNFESYPASANIGGQAVGSTTWSAAGTGSGGQAMVASGLSFAGGSKSLCLIQTATGFRPRATLNLVSGGFIPSALGQGSVAFAVREDPATPSGTNYYTVNIGNVALSRAASGGVGKLYFSVAGGTAATISFTGAQHAYTPTAWNQIEVAFDNTAKTASLYVNGGLAGTVTGASADFTVSSVTLGLYSSSLTSDKVFFDALEASQ